jgi:hypothetical protein
MRKAWPALLALGIIAACSDQNVTPPASSTPAQTPAFSSISSGAQRQIAADLPLLPIGVDHSVRPPEVVRAAYDFAARHPEVLNYIPCFCGCESRGHRGNTDCFVGSRDSNGRVIEWETHALGCEICLDVATESMQMHNSGASTSAIRAAIDKKYAEYHSRMQTPMPPHKGMSHED